MVDSAVSVSSLGLDYWFNGEETVASAAYVSIRICRLRFGPTESKSSSTIIVALLKLITHLLTRVARRVERIARYDGTAIVSS